MTFFLIVHTQKKPLKHKIGLIHVHTKRYFSLTMKQQKIPDGFLTNNHK